MTDKEDKRVSGQNGGTEGVRRTSGVTRFAHTWIPPTRRFRKKNPDVDSRLSISLGFWKKPIC